MNEKNYIIPITIETNEIQNQIDMFAYDFEQLVKIGNYEIVFRSPEVFFILKDGFCFCTPHFELFQTYKEFYEVISKLRSNGFKEPIEYEEAMRLNILSLEKYKEFKESRFYEGNFKLHNSDANTNQIRSQISQNKSKYEKYLSAKAAGFENERDYDNAKQLDCINARLFFEFLHSEFFQNERHFSHEKSNYQMFVKAKEMGFQNKEEFNKATSLGFNDIASYKQFVESGCETKEDFDRVIEFQKTLPDFIQNLKEKINEIRNDSKKALDSNSSEEYVRLNYLLLEKMSELSYFELYKIPLDEINNLNTTEILQKIEEKSQKKFIDYDELHKWRIIRNKIVHDHYKIDESTLNDAKRYFNQVIPNLDK